jgi:hypothetical protein
MHASQNWQKQSITWGVRFIAIAMGHAMPLHMCHVHVALHLLVIV